MVKNLIRLNGNAVANQFVIETKRYKYFQSYNSVVCKFDKYTKKLTLSQYWDYSITTLKYLYHFLRNHCYIFDIDSKKEVMNRLKNKEITLIKKNNIDI